MILQSLQNKAKASFFRSFFLTTLTFPPVDSYFISPLLPNSFDLSFEPFFVSYPVGLSYPTFLLKPNEGTVLVPSKGHQHLSRKC